MEMFTRILREVHITFSHEFHMWNLPYKRLTMSFERTAINAQTRGYSFEIHACYNIHMNFTWKRIVYLNNSADEFIVQMFKIRLG
jgi:hypothetical protein